MTIKTYARIVNGTVVDVTITDRLDELFHPDLVRQFVVVPDGTQNGYLLIDGQIVPPPSPTAP